MDEIQVERDDNGVVTLTLDRPHVKNAIVGEMWEELRRIFQDVTQNERDRVLVITGAGSGIGRALAAGFCEDGAQVVGFGRRSAAIEETSSNPCGNRRTASPCDLVVGPELSAGCQLTNGSSRVCASMRARSREQSMRVPSSLRCRNIVSGGGMRRKPWRKTSRIPASRARSIRFELPKS